MMIDDYNLHIGGVDKRVVFHLLDLSIVNSSIIYNTVAEKSLTQLDFRLSLVASPLEGHKRPADRRHVLPTRVLPVRLSKRLFPKPIRKETSSGNRPQCKVCSARRKKGPRLNFSVKSIKHHYA